MKNNLKVSLLGNKEVKTLGAKKLAETMTFVNDVIFNKEISDEMLDKLSDKHLMECWIDYGKYTNNLLKQHKQIKFDEKLLNEWNFYMTRFFSLYILIYKMDNDGLKKLLYEDMKVQEVMKRLDMKTMKFIDIFGKFEIEVFTNAQFFKYEKLK